MAVQVFRHFFCLDTHKLATDQADLVFRVTPRPKSDTLGRRYLLCFFLVFLPVCSRLKVLIVMCQFAAGAGAQTVGVTHDDVPEMRLTSIWIVHPT